MNFQDLHEQLRRELERRVEKGELTGTALARQTGFRQGHVSNFLRRKRWLSLEGLDRVLAAQGLTVEDLLPGEPPGPLDLSGAAAEMAAEPEADVGRVPIVAAATAMEAAIIRPESVLETVAVSAARLAEQRAQPAVRRAGWQRFVAVRADAAEARALEPMIAPGAVVVIDRHYNSAAPYRAQQRTLYAVRSGAGLALRFVEAHAGALMLRPLAQDVPVQLVRLGPRESVADYLVGRVCVVVNEL